MKRFSNKILIPVSYIPRKVSPRKTLSARVPLDSAETRISDLNYIPSVRGGISRKTETKETHQQPWRPIEIRLACTSHPSSSIYRAMANRPGFQK